MHLRTIVLFSIGLNLVLGIGWATFYFNNFVYSRRPIVRQVLSVPPASGTNPVNAGGRSASRFHWSAVESEDYPTYIANLRSIGCPESTIRDIIVADINHQFAERRREQLLTSDFSWWRTSGSQSEELSQRQAALESLERERRQLLTDLLGPDWDRSEAENDPVANAGIFLAGPVLGELPEESKEAVYDIATRARARMQEYVETQEFLGQPIDPVQLGRLRQEMRTELAQILTPPQMEEFLLRYSDTAERMRSELRGLELSPDEFRTLFRLRDPLEHEMLMLGNPSNPAVEGRVATLQKQLDDSLRQVLGPERYLEYQLNEDPSFRETRERAEQLGANRETMFSIYAINQEAAVEQQRIRSDPSLSEQQKSEALAQIQEDQERALQRLLGQQRFQQWQQLQLSR